MGGALHPVHLCSVALTTQILSLGKIRSVKQHHFIYHTVWFPSSLITYFLFGLCVKCTVVGLRLPLLVFCEKAMFTSSSVFSRDKIYSAIYFSSGGNSTGKFAVEHTCTLFNRYLFVQLT